eukprot:843051-Pelagomonas_calceolata.AAC.3
MAQRMAPALAPPLFSLIVLNAQESRSLQPRPTLTLVTMSRIPLLVAPSAHLNHPTFPVLSAFPQCTQDATQYVTSDDFILDPNFPSVQVRHAGALPKHAQRLLNLESEHKACPLVT